uniref:DNA2/NAM7 helicase-like C-terminal domain-containing protein n=1 Tax=Romanomermis culicivorax TaxID=13658 RepID=A0A915J3Q6_ROMCU
MAPQISKAICDLLIHKKFHDPTTTCKYYHVAANHNNVLDSSKLNTSQNKAIHLSETIYISITQVTLLGNPCQLGPCMTSREAEQMGFGHTLFERLYYMHIPYMLLNQQYRMHPAIGSIVSDLMYGNRVQNCTKKGNNVPHFRRLHSPTSKVISDNDEWLPYRLDSYCNRRISRRKFQINAKYRQRDCLYQGGRFGQESDIVIYDIVWSNQYLTMGFLENFKCLNVAIS